MSLQALPDVLAEHPGFEATPDFPAFWQGRRVLVTAVLVRTAVIQTGRVEDKVLVRHSALLVGPADITWVKSRNLILTGHWAISRGSAQRGQAKSREATAVKRQAREMDILRVQGKIRCPRCRTIKAREVCYANGYCKDGCATAYMRERRARIKQEAS